MVARMSSKPNLFVKRSVNIGTMIKFNGNGDGDGDSICKQALRENHQALAVKGEKHPMCGIESNPGCSSKDSNPGHSSERRTCYLGDKLNQIATVSNWLLM